MSANPEPQRVCPKCGDTRPLSAFKLRSRSQGRSPSWCKVCRNRMDRDRRARQQERDINEFFRRIRRGSPPTRTLTLFVLATRRAGGINAINQKLVERLSNANVRYALAAARIVTKVGIAYDRLPAGH